MLRVNQLSGFGGSPNPYPIINIGTSPNTNNPSYTIDLGPPGVKQVMAVFACSDSEGSDPWFWDTGTVGGENFTYVVPGNDVQAGTGTSFTGGATIRSLETSLSGIQTVTIPILSFIGTMTNNRMLAFVVRGFNATPISVDFGENEVAGDGNNFTLNTVGARLVIGGASASTSPGDLQGPGSEVTAFTSTNLAFGYDLAPAGGASDVYSFTGAKYVIAGASFG
jgi:hypothetical protein